MGEIRRVGSHSLIMKSSRERERILPESPVEIITDSIHYIEVGTGCAGNGAVPTVTDSTVHVASVETLKIQIHLKQILR